MKILFYTNCYYYTSHFSKFIRYSAMRIIASSNRDKLQTTTFINTDGKIAIVVPNTSADTVPCFLWIRGQAAETKSLPHSISALIIE